MNWTNNQTITLLVWYQFRDGYLDGVEDETGWFYRGQLLILTQAGILTLITDISIFICRPLTETAYKKRKCIIALVLARAYVLLYAVV